MCYRVTVRRDGQDDFIIGTEADDFTIEHDMEETPGILVELGYKKSRIQHHDQEGYRTLLGMWPGEAMIVLSQSRHDGDDCEGEWRQVFDGMVTKVSTDEYDLRVTAHKKPDASR